MKFIAAKIEQLLCCIKSALERGYPVTAGTTATLARQATGTTDYADAALVSISVTTISGTVTVNSVTLDVGATVEFTAEPGALLTGAFSVNCGSSAGVALVARTRRS